MDRWQPLFWQSHRGFQSIAPWAREYDWQDWPAPSPYYAALSRDHLPVKFADVQNVSYEQHIAHTGAVPTRYANWHDFFNAMIWQAFPRSKSVLNDMHMLGHSGGSERGKRRDAATLFDESGAIFITAHPHAQEALKNMNWQSLFVDNRQWWQNDIKVLVFGHGILDKLRAPYIGLTAHCLVLDTDARAIGELNGEAIDFNKAAISHVDDSLSAVLKQVANKWTSRDLLPLPLLGIPEWHSENSDVRFYDNADYFRATRNSQSKSL